MATGFRVDVNGPGEKTPGDSDDGAGRCLEAWTGLLDDVITISANVDATAVPVLPGRTQ